VCVLIERKFKIRIFEYSNNFRYSNSANRIRILFSYSNYRIFKYLTTALIRTNVAQYQVIITVSCLRIIQDLPAKVLVGRQVAVEGVCHEVVGEWKMFCDVFNRPRVKVQVQQALVTAVETADLPRELEQLRERLQTRPATVVNTEPFANV